MLRIFEARRAAYSRIFARSSEFSGAGMGAVVKTTVYLTSLLDFDLMNEVRAEYFPFQPPARATIEVAALPKGALVEIDAVAVLPSAPEVKYDL